MMGSVPEVGNFSSNRPSTSINLEAVNASNSINEEEVPSTSNDQAMRQKNQTTDALNKSSYMQQDDDDEPFEIPGKTKTFHLISKEFIPISFNNIERFSNIAFGILKIIR